jgi:hypothetical protein
MLRRREFHVNAGSGFGAALMGRASVADSMPSVRRCLSTSRIPMLKREKVRETKTDRIMSRAENEYGRAIESGGPFGKSLLGGGF